MSINFLGPYRPRENLTIMPFGDESLSVQQTKVPLQLFSEQFVFTSINIEDCYWDSFFRPIYHLISLVLVLLTRVYSCLRTFFKYTLVMTKRLLRMVLLKSETCINTLKATSQPFIISPIRFTKGESSCFETVVLSTWDRAEQCVKIAA